MHFKKIACGALALGLSICLLRALAEEPVVIQVDIAESGSHAKKAAVLDLSNVAAWLSPVDPATQAAAKNAPQRPEPVIIQKNKMFQPHVTVVPVGSSIAFPNEDPFFHDVFSLFNGKRFDLGLYEAGTTRTQRFDRLGVSYIFCNIHENMSAVVIAVDTPFFGVSDRTGRVEIADVPDGHYTLHFFYERSTADQLKSLDRAVAISSSSRSIDGVHVATSPDVSLTHKNKYGQDYVLPSSSGYGP
jgi:plastocyanin